MNPLIAGLVAELKNALKGLGVELGEAAKADRDGVKYEIAQTGDLSSERYSPHSAYENKAGWVPFGYSNGVITWRRRTN